MKGYRHIPSLLLVAGIGVASFNNACSQLAAQVAAVSCSKLGSKADEQAVRAFTDAALALEASARNVEAQFLAACNGMNKDLGLTTGATASEACATLHGYIQQAAAKGVTVKVDVIADCKVTATLDANCTGSCQVSAACDVEAKCEPGKLVVACDGTCSGACDVVAPSVQCTGKCYGECKGSVAVACAGQCKGTCSGTCNGTCNGNTVNGKCEGTCVGSCTAGTCQGSCTASAGVDCTGECSGTCTFTDPQASCKGECHGSCSAEASPPRCEGKLDCDVSGSCNASCSAKAQASVNCPEPTVAVTIVGDDKLSAAVNKYAKSFGQAVNSTLALRDPIVNLANNTGPALDAAISQSSAAASCLSSGVALIGQASASISVSVTASASFRTTG